MGPGFRGPVNSVEHVVRHPMLPIWHVAAQPGVRKDFCRKIAQPPPASICSRSQANLFGAQGNPAIHAICRKLGGIAQKKGGQVDVARDDSGRGQFGPKGRDLRNQIVLDPMVGRSHKWIGRGHLPQSLAMHRAPIDAADVMNPAEPTESSAAKLFFGAALAEKGVVRRSCDA